MLTGRVVPLFGLLVVLHQLIVDSNIVVNRTILWIDLNNLFVPNNSLLIIFHCSAIDYADLIDDSCIIWVHLVNSLELCDL